MIGQVPQPFDHTIVDRLALFQREEALSVYSCAPPKHAGSGVDAEGSRMYGDVRTLCAARLQYRGNLVNDELKQTRRRHSAVQAAHAAAAARPASKNAKRFIHALVSVS